MSRKSRKKLIKKIEETRKSKVIVYVTSDRTNLAAQIAGDAPPILHEHILAIAEKDRKKLDLLLYSRGGHSDVPWTTVSMFREYCKEGSFGVLIPFRAHSAATVISIGADEIVMTRKAELGPIDITINGGPYNPKDVDSHERMPISVEDVSGYFALLEKVGCGRPDEKMRGFQHLTDKVHPLALGTVSRLLEQTELVALRLLGTRAKPFAEDKNREIVRRLSSEIYSHNHTISRTEAIEQLGLEQVVTAEKEQIADELWALYNEYRELFELDHPFLPEEYLIANNLEEYTWKNLNLACVESLDRFDICRRDLQVRKLKQIPPQVSLNLNNVAFPTFSIPALPQGVTPQQVAQLVEQITKGIIQQTLVTAAQQGAREFLNSLPPVGFQHIVFNSGWRKEKN